MAQSANIAWLRPARAFVRKEPEMAGPAAAAPWRRTFLRELARSGSVKLAAALCGIHRTSPYAHRKTNPAFAASWERALAEARERLGAGQAGELAAAPRLAEDEFVRSSKSGKPCIARAGPGRWSARREKAFLDELANSANVSAAAAAAGVSTTAVYNRRRLRPDFARAWDEALRQGYARLEAHLLCAATSALDPDPAFEVRGELDVGFAEGLNLLRLHHAAVHGGHPRRHDWRMQLPDITVVQAEVRTKMEAIARSAQAQIAPGEHCA